MTAASISSASGDDFAAGFTIVVDGVERYVRGIATLAHSIEAELNFPVQVNAYVARARPDRRGAGPPIRRPRCADPASPGFEDLAPVRRRPHPGARSATARQGGTPEGLSRPTDVRVEVGDVLYLPRGLVHAADTEAETSVHLTVGVHTPTAFALAIGALHSLQFSRRPTERPAATEASRRPGHACLPSLPCFAPPPPPSRTRAPSPAASTYWRTSWCAGAGARRSGRSPMRQASMETHW